MSEIARIKDESELDAISSKTWKRIVITIGIVFLLAAGIMVVLALMGPSIGNIYSNITSYT
jgi:hypothetical protein